MQQVISKCPDLCCNSKICRTRCQCCWAWVPVFQYSKVGFESDQDDKKLER